MLDLPYIALRPTYPTLPYVGPTLCQTYPTSDLPYIGPILHWTYPTPTYVGPTLHWTYPTLDLPYSALHQTCPTLVTYPMPTYTYSTPSSLSVCELSLAMTPSAPLLNPQVHERFLTEGTATTTTWDNDEEGTRQQHGEDTQQ